MKPTALLLLAAAIIVAAGCGSKREETLRIAGIPDQNSSALARRYQTFTDYLAAELGVAVEYVPTVNYAATVSAFQLGDVDMAWFGGLTGVQARLAVPGSEAIAQRARDAEFHSKFIVQAGLDVETLADLAGLTFAFGSESSTSGHLMPRHYLLQAGIDPDADFNGPANYTGSHDKTWALVEGGALQAGALSEAVWEKAVADGRVDTSKVREFFTTPPYFDYNWTVRGDIEEKFGPGFTEKVQEVILSIDASQQGILDLFTATRFIESNNENYEAIRAVAQSLGIVGR